jgi:hypothetical protein
VRQQNDNSLSAIFSFTRRETIVCQDRLGTHSQTEGTH